MVHSIVQITHKTKHQAFISRMDLQAIMTLLIGDGAYIGDFPIDIDTGEGLTFSVNLFVNGSLDDILSHS